MKQVLILYFSGAGATKHVAALMLSHLREKCDATMCSLEDVRDTGPARYDALIVGTPVYHAAPARQVMEYFDVIRPAEQPIPAFLYNTRALWSCNTNRILAKKLKEKGIVTIQDRAYRSPASDGSLLVPFVPRFFAFERQLDTKVARDCDRFLSLLESDDAPLGYIPRFRFSSILNGPNKLAGQLTTFQIHLHRDACTRCAVCVNHCPHHAITVDAGGYPSVEKERCENCYRCIHHCPSRALSLSKGRRPRKQLYAKSCD